MLYIVYIFICTTKLNSLKSYNNIFITINIIENTYIDSFIIKHSYIHLNISIIFIRVVCSKSL